MAYKHGNEFMCYSEGDIIEIRLKSGIAHKPYFYGYAPLNNRKKVRELLNIIEQKGVPLSKQWFE